MAQHTIRLFIASPVDLRLLADFLRSLGYEVHAHGLSAIPDSLPGTSLVIADEEAANRYGRRILDLKWRSGIGFLPILILLPRQARSAHWIEAGFDDVLREPISKQELKARLDVFLRFREQSEEYRRLFENALIGIFRCAADGHILMANPAFLKMLGCASFEELFVQGAQQHRAICSLLEPLAAHGVLAGAEVNWQRRDGSELVGLVNARPVHEDGRLLYIEGSVEDITERKRAENAREEMLARERAARAESDAANRLKDEFLATVSHELRTPLSAIVGWAQLLRLPHAKSASLAQGLEVIERQARAQAKLIDDLLDVSRIITGKLRLDPTAVNPRAFIDAGIDTVRPAADAKGVRIRKEVPDEVDTMVGDASRLQQIVWNLLSNAVKFTPSGGEVTVRLERVDSNVQISVSDTGEGISPDFLPYVFDRFRQRDGTTTRKHGGLGVGLSIVRHLVELHGGTVRALSDGEGRGATVIVTLPIIENQPRDHRTAAAGGTISAIPPVQLPSLAGLKVLVVDDEADSLELLRNVLVESGAEVMTAPSAERALRVLEHAAPHVLISDIGMPGCDGYELIRAVRARHDGRIRAAALTAYAGAEDRARALSAGYEAHIAKPVEPVLLIAAVADLVGRVPASLT